MVKKSQSEVITTVLIILLVLAAVFIVYLAVTSMIKKSTGQANANIINVGLTASTSSGVFTVFSINVSRSAGEGNISAIKIIFKDDSGHTCAYENTTRVPRELETVFYAVDVSKDCVPNLANASSYDVYPIFSNGQIGLKAIGGGSGGGGGGSGGNGGGNTNPPSGCSVATQATDCNDSNNCTIDTCSSGTCSNTQISPVCSDPSSVSCGQQISSSNGCGTCASGTKCSSGTCVSGSCYSPPMAGNGIGIGCTTAYYIDKDCDGYGVGAPNGPDADDNDKDVNTVASWQAKYNNSLTSFVNHLGYYPNRIYYIAANGSDATGAVNDITRPYAHYGAVISALHSSPGGMVVFRGGNYSDAISPGDAGFPSWYPSTTASSPAVFISYPGERALLIQDSTVYLSTTYDGGNNKNMIVDGIAIEEPGNTGLGYGIYGDHTENITIRNFEAYGFDDALLVAYAKNFTIENSVFHDNAHHAIYFGFGIADNPLPGGNDYNFDQMKQAPQLTRNATFDILIKGNLVYHNGVNGFDALHINTIATNVVVEGNILHDVGGSPITLQTGVYNSIIRNNLIFNSADAAITLNLYNSSANTPSGVWHDDYFFNMRNNSILNNILWTGRDNIQGIPPSYGVLVAVDLDVANISWIKDTTIKNNIIVTYNTNPVYGFPAFDFRKNSYPNTTIIQNNVIYNSWSGASTADRVMHISPNAFGGTGADTNYNWAQFQAYNPALINNNTYADPLFNDTSLDYTSTPGKFDFDLTSGSPAINFGTSVGAPATDLRGKIRTGNPDAGCYEY